MITLHGGWAGKYAVFVWLSWTWLSGFSFPDNCLTPLPYNDTQSNLRDQVLTQSEVDRCVDRLLAKLDGRVSANSYPGYKLHKQVRRDLENGFRQYLVGLYPGMSLFPSAINKVIKNAMLADLGFAAPKDYHYIARHPTGEYHIFSPSSLNIRLSNRERKLLQLSLRYQGQERGTLIIYALSLNKNNFPFSVEDKKSQRFYFLEKEAQSVSMQNLPDWKLRVGYRKPIHLFLFRGDGSPFGLKMMETLSGKLQKLGYVMTNPPEILNNYQEVMDRFGRSLEQSSVFLKQGHSGGRQTVVNMPQKGLYHSYHKAGLQIHLLFSQRREPNRETDAGQLSEIFKRRFEHDHFPLLIIDGSCYSSALFERYWASYWLGEVKEHKEMPLFLIGASCLQHPQEIHDLFLFLLSRLERLATNRIDDGVTEGSDFSIRDMWPRMVRFQRPEQRGCWRNSGQRGNIIRFSPPSLRRVDGITLAGHHKNKRARSLTVMSTSLAPEHMKQLENGPRSVQSAGISAPKNESGSIYQLTNVASVSGSRWKVVLYQADGSSTVEVHRLQQKEIGKREIKTYKFNLSIIDISLSSDGGILFSDSEVGVMRWDLDRLSDPLYVQN